MGIFAKHVRKWPFYHSNLQTKFGVHITSNIFTIIQFKNHGIAPPPPHLPTLTAYPTPAVGGRFGIFSLKWRKRMNLKVPGAILPLGCAILSTRTKTVRGWLQPPLGELGLITLIFVHFRAFIEIEAFQIIFLFELEKAHQTWMCFQLKDTILALV